MSQDVELDPNKIAILLCSDDVSGRRRLYPAQIPLNEISLPSHIFEYPPVLTQSVDSKQRWKGSRGETLQETVKTLQIQSRRQALTSTSFPSHPGAHRDTRLSTNDESMSPCPPGGETPASEAGEGRHGSRSRFL